MADVLDALRGGDLRSIGRVAEVVAAISKQPRLLSRLMDGLSDADPRVRMRCADAIEKLTRARAEWLAPFKARLLRELTRSEQKEVRWHMAQLIPRLELTGAERSSALRVLLGYLSDDSKIVRTFSMQALFDLARDDARLRKRVAAMLEQRVEQGSPAERSRAKKLLRQLDQ